MRLIAQDAKTVDLLTYLRIYCTAQDELDWKRYLPLKVSLTFYFHLHWSFKHFGKYRIVFMYYTTETKILFDNFNPDSTMKCAKHFYTIFYFILNKISFCFAKLLLSVMLVRSELYHFLIEIFCWPFFISKTTVIHILSQFLSSLKHVCLKSTVYILMTALVKAVVTNYSQHFFVCLIGWHFPPRHD